MYIQSILFAWMAKMRAFILFSISHLNKHTKHTLKNKEDITSKRTNKPKRKRQRERTLKAKKYAQMQGERDIAYIYIYMYKYMKEQTQSREKKKRRNTSVFQACTSRNQQILWDNVPWCLMLMVVLRRFHNFLDLFGE